MLQTTFCKDCGKVYDASLPECPVCARKRAEEQAVRSGAKQPEPRRMTVAERVRSAVNPPEEATIVLSPEEIAAAAEAARQQAAPVTQPEPDLPATGEEEQPKPAFPVGKLIRVLLLTAVALVALVFCVGLMSGKKDAPAKTPTAPVTDTDDAPQNEDHTQQEENTPSQQPEQPETQPEPEQPEPEPEPTPEPEPPAEPDTPDVPITDPEPQPEPEPEPQPEPEPEPQPEPEPEPDTEPDTEPEDENSL